MKKKTLRIELVDHNNDFIKTLYDMPFDPFVGKNKISIHDRLEAMIEYNVVDQEVFIVNDRVTISYSLVPSVSY